MRNLRWAVTIRHCAFHFCYYDAFSWDWIVHENPIRESNLEVIYIEQPVTGHGGNSRIIASGFRVPNSFYRMLGRDVLSEILRRVDGATLARAACASTDMATVCESPELWRTCCEGLWPSARQPALKNVVESAFGGFRLFYSQCSSSSMYALENHCRKTTKEAQGDHISGDDLVWAVDVWFGDQVAFSQVKAGVSHDAGNGLGFGHNPQDVCEDEKEHLRSWFLQIPFRLCFNGADRAGSGTKVSAKKTAGAGGEEWQKRRVVAEKTRLSWIVLNRRTKKALNLSTPTWAPSEVLSYGPWRCTSDHEEEFVLRFTRAVPMPCRGGSSVKYVMDVRCTVSDKEDEQETAAEEWMNVHEVSLHLEELEHGRGHLNGADALRALAVATAPAWCCLRRAVTVNSRKAAQQQSRFLSAQRYVDVLLHDGRHVGAEFVDTAASAVAVVTLILLLWCVIVCEWWR